MMNLEKLLKKISCRKIIRKERDLTKNVKKNLGKTLTVENCEVSTRPEVRCTRCGWARG